MKFLASIIFAVSSLASIAMAQAPLQIGPHNIKVSKIQPAVISTPEYNIDIANKRSEKLKWLEIEVEFDVDKIDKTQVIDELTFKYTLMLNGKLYTGEVTHVNIPKGNNRYSVMYMSPRSIDRATGGSALNSGMIENIWVTVDRQGQELGQKSYQNKPMPNLPKVPGMLVPKSETPFQVLWWDRYEAVKVQGR